MSIKGVRKTAESRDRDRTKVRVDEVRDNEPTMPHGLTAYAQEQWRIAVDYLRADGRLHGNQATILERWAITCDRAKVIDAIISVQGVMNEDGRPHPLLSASIALAEKIRMMARELGMTPASRLPTLKPAERPELAPVSPIAALLRARERRA
jgi:phage terminase small subunit